MEFRKKVELPVGEAEIRHSDKLLLWGSCFVENMAGRLMAGKFDCRLNPYGVLYNPLSIAVAMDRLLTGYVYTQADLLAYRGLWCSLMHHGSFSDADPGRCLARIRAASEDAAAFLKEADWLLVTFGTARVYEWKETGQVVGNCHKLPERQFVRRLAGVDEIVCTYAALLDRLHALNPRLQVLFTVSPIRHARDGMHGNQLSKAVLLLAVDRLCSQRTDCHYFPAYEILLDELRDYRFYADDMLHPSAQAVEYIWECFGQTYFTAATQSLLREVAEVRRGVEHRPFRPDSEEYRRFLSQILLKIAQLQEKFPYLDFQKETEICQTQLKK